MLAIGPARKITIHLNEDTSSEHDYLYKEIFELLWQSGVAGATLIRPQGGFGSHHRRHEDKVPGAQGLHLPIRIEFIESIEKVEGLLPALYELVTDGMIEAQNVTILRTASREEKP